MRKYIFKFRMFVNYVTLDGQYIQVLEEKLIVEHWIMFVHKYCKEIAMTLA